VEPANVSKVVYEEPSLEIWTDRVSPDSRLEVCQSKVRVAAVYPLKSALLLIFSLHI
jgi:hypothetical protein